MFNKLTTTAAKTACLQYTPSQLTAIAQHSHYIILLVEVVVQKVA